ncbi:unnamed protein product [Schistosoma mattheei]|uniref:Uncharacterized protein n=1 Tax=Schistosoma mattheei TaxID=31246 RepID=A0AA85BZN9_9TREM|nr:unnamed protein product [Schistosoma mattheei]
MYVNLCVCMCVLFKDEKLCDIYDEKTSAIKSNSNDLRRIVHNLLDRSLTSHEITLLEKGLNFTLHKKPLSTIEIALIIEPRIAQLPEKESRLLRRKHITPNISKEEFKVLHSLQKDKTIIITKVNKGTTIVVINKAIEHLSTGPYEKINPKKFSND